MNLVRNDCIVKLDYQQTLFLKLFNFRSSYNKNPCAGRLHSLTAHVGPCRIWHD